MRKRYKLKKYSCALCKPHKMGWALRWKPKELAVLHEFESVKKTIDSSWPTEYTVNT